ncbi:acyl-CoA dehydrogenase family protein [Pseudomonas aeruginosa]
MELCWGDVGLLLAMPRQRGWARAAIARGGQRAAAPSAALPGRQWRSTEPGCGSDSAAIRTTATQDGDHYVLNGEKIFVTSGERGRCRGGLGHP